MEASTFNRPKNTYMQDNLEHPKMARHKSHTTKVIIKKTRIHNIGVSSHLNLK